jgi:hypothetical protein
MGGYFPQPAAVNRIVTSRTFARETSIRTALELLANSRDEPSQKPYGHRGSCPSAPGIGELMRIWARGVGAAHGYQLLESGSAIATVIEWGHGRLLM